MRIVTITAGDARREHLALLERSVVIDFIEHLAVGLIESLAEKRHDMGIGKRLSRYPVLCNLAPPRVAASTGFDLLAELGGSATPLRGSVLIVTATCNSAPLVEPR